MNKGINEIGAARLCPACQLEMANEYVMRCVGQMSKGICHRCGKERPVTMKWLYTMKGNEKKRRGLI